jgi:4-amino-4-deoxy-L-arabinose transferase-like glycosyltransferase
MATGASPTDADTRVDPRRLGALALAALVIRLAFILLEPGSKLAGDEWTWYRWAVSPPGGVASETVRFSPLRTNLIFEPPLYPYFIAVLHEATGTDPETKLRVVKLGQAVLGALLVMAVGGAGTRVFGARVGTLAAAFAAFYPELVWFSAHFWSETLFMALLWWAIERLLASEEGGYGRLAAAGFLWGLACLTRETVLYFIPFAALWLAWGTPFRWRRGAAFAVVAVLTIAPWTYRNWVVFHAFIPVGTAGGQNLFQSNAGIDRDVTYEMVKAVKGRDRREVAVLQYQYARRMGLEAILARQPLWIFEKLYEQMPNFWEADSLALVHVKRGADTPPGGYGPVRVRAAWAVALVVLVPYLALLAGFVAGLRSIPWTRGSVLLLGFLVFYNALHVVAHGFARYRMPVLPVLFLVAAWAIAAPSAARTFSRGRSRLALAAAIVLAVSIVPSVRKDLAHPALGGSGAATDRDALDDAGASAP